MLFEDAGLIQNCMTGLSGFEAGSFRYCIIGATVGIETPTEHCGGSIPLVSMKTWHSRESFTLSLVISVPQMCSICARNVGKKNHARHATFSITMIMQLSRTSQCFMLFLTCSDAADSFCRQIFTGGSDLYVVF